MAGDDGQTEARVSRRRALIGTAAAGVGAGALMFPAVAAASAFSVNVQDLPYSARGNGSTDDTTAIQNAINAAPAGGTIIVPPGTYKLTRSLELVGKRLVGSGLDASILRQDTASAAVVTVGSDSTYIGDLTLKHNTLPTAQSVPNGVGIRINNLGDRSVIERCLLMNNTSGIYSNQPVSGVTNYVYSVGIRDLRIERFTHSGIYLSATGAGNTGSVLQNIYIINSDEAGLLEAQYGVFLGVCGQVIAQQINVEWGAYGWPITVNSCDTALIESVNLEGCAAAANYGAFLSSFGGPHVGVRFSNVLVNNCTVDGEYVELYSLYRMDGHGRVTLEGVNVRNTRRVGSPQMRRVYAGSLEGEENPALHLKAVELDAPWGGDYYVGTEVPVLREENEWRLWAKGVVVHGSNPNVPRPPWNGSVEWVGTVEPNNGEEGDTWVIP